MTEFVLAFDPGKSTGVALGSYSDTNPYRLERAWQFSGGISGLLGWLGEHIKGDRFFVEPRESAITLSLVTVISEKYSPIPGGGFNQSLDSTLPLVGEGVLIGWGLMPPYTPSEKRWQRPASMYRHGGKNLAEKKKKSRAFLKKHGLYVTGSQVGQPDSDDAMSAILHALNYLTHTLHHKPTWDTYYAAEEL